MPRSVICYTAARFGNRDRCLLWPIGVASICDDDLLVFTVLCRRRPPGDEISEMIISLITW